MHARELWKWTSTRSAHERLRLLDQQRRRRGLSRQLEIDTVTRTIGVTRLEYCVPHLDDSRFWPTRIFILPLDGRIEEWLS